MSAGGRSRSSRAVSSRSPDARAALRVRRSGRQPVARPPVRHPVDRHDRASRCSCSAPSSWPRRISSVSATSGAESAEMSVYLDDDASAENRQAVEALLAAGRLVAGHQFVSKDEALRGSRRRSRIWRARSRRSKGTRCRRPTKCGCRPAPGAKDAVAQLAVQARTDAGRVRRPVRPAVARPPALGRGR